MIPPPRVLVSCVMPLGSIAGHPRLLSLLSRAMARQTLPPALLLSGPGGVGKRTTALALAETLNCPQPRTLGNWLEIDACGACASCRRIARGVHPDVIVLEPGETGAIRIDEVRDVIDRANYRPFEGRRRVVIVDEADTMAPAAQNALLKTLEEPPSASVFMLVSSMPDALLPTVRSRCPRLRFGALLAADVAGVLMRDHGYTEAEARAAAADADGSIGCALAVRNVDLVGARDAAQRLLEHAARVSNPVHRLELARNLTGKKSATAAERDQLAVCLRALASLLRDLGVLAVRADTSSLANADLQADLGPLSDAFDSERSTRAFTAVDRALGALERNVGPKVVADWLVLQL
ncbi:MAG: DNA polymerase III subunit delta' [Acidobacteria bacterium]|nr:DNA polymerase III subunit delta' [Acidobacteriota bacterium]